MTQWLNDSMTQWLSDSRNQGKRDKEKQSLNPKRTIFASFGVFLLIIRARLNMYLTGTTYLRPALCDFGLWRDPLDLQALQDLQKHAPGPCSYFQEVVNFKFKLDGDLADSKPPPIFLPSLDSTQQTQSPPTPIPVCSTLPPSISSSHFEHTPCGGSDSCAR